MLAIAAAALGPAAAASAKEIASVQICGADGCRDVTDRTTMAIAEGGPSTSPPDATAPSYRVKVSMKAPEGGADAGWSFVWVPKAGKLALEDGTWTNPPSTTVGELERASRGMEPLPASELALPAPSVASAPAAASAPAPATTPPSRGGQPAVVWVFIAAGALGVALALARGAAALAARRRGAAPAS